MVLEIAGARVMAPVFGLSAVPWTAVIGVVLTALAAGNWVGGRLADGGRVPLAFVLLAAAGTAFAPLAGTVVPATALDLLGFIPGAVASAVVFFALPVFGLGMVTPYLIRAETRTVDEVGRRAGEIGAAATAGSIAGTFGTGFVLLPLLPLPLLLGLVALGFVALAALARGLLGGGPDPVALATVGVIAVGVGVGASAPGEGVVATEQTVYASIVVRDGLWSDGAPVREMLQNGSSSSVEYLDTGEPAHPYVTTALSWIDELPRSPRRILVVGGAALTLPLALARRFPEATVDVIEVDPRATELAFRHFAVGRDDAAERIEVDHGGGRLLLERSERSYDLVYLDAFDHLVAVPWTLVTEEAFEAVARRLAPGGSMAMNVLTPLAGPGTTFVERLLLTVARVYPDVRAWRVAPDVELERVQNVLLAAALDPGVLPRSFERTAIPLAARGPVLTDARAPVEWLQARVFLGGLDWQE
jgi:predicted membrane-bound spermidine synthase